MNMLENIRGKKVLVVGDVMLDRYWWGSVSRISPEAPVPIVQMEKTSLVAGGAANVAANLAGLGATPVLFGIKGDDAEGRALDDILSESGIEQHHVLPIEGRETSIKTRIVAHSQHVVRIDRETTEPISREDADDIVDRISGQIARCDAVIISDYGKGFLIDTALADIIDLCKTDKKVVLVDPKGRDFSKYSGATVITPNRKEAIDATGETTVQNAGNSMLSNLGVDAVLVTEGKDGMTLFQRGHDAVHLDSLAQTVFDVTGAGDTVIATFAAAVAAGVSFVDAAKLANAAAGIVVGRIGTTRITTEMLAEFIASEDHAHHFHA